ncbi:hypothetical protein DL769_008088 [Monosporascus sp. CRB-8-3]|nr:hypothetical protein DL769_008088 [Monosporascus sp. CRB-8-3]
MAWLSPSTFLAVGLATTERTRATERSRRRPIVSPTYKGMEPLVDKNITRWLAKLDERFAATGERFDLASWAIYVAYAVVSEVGFGAPFGFVEQGRDVDGLIRGFHDRLMPFGVMARLYLFTNWIKSTWAGEKYLVASPEQGSGIGVLMRFRDRLIAQRYKGIEAGTTDGRIDFLQTRIEARDEDGKPQDHEYVKAEILLILIAGSDTTATAFQALMQNVLSDDAVYEKTMAGVDVAAREKKLSDMPQYEEVLEHCPYYRDRRIYGPDAEEFRPGRWLDDPEKAREYQKYSLTFGYGARGCLGKDLPQMELFRTPLQFFRAFTPRAANPRGRGGIGRRAASPPLPIRGSRSTEGPRSCRHTETDVEMVRADVRADVPCRDGARSVSSG